MFYFDCTAFQCLSILPSLWTFWWAPVCLTFAQLHVVLECSTPLLSTLLSAFWEATPLQPLKRNARWLLRLLWLLYFCFSSLTHRNPPPVLVGTWNRAAALENTLMIPQNVKHRVTVWSRVYIIEICVYIWNCMYMSFYNSIIYNT